MHLHRLSGQDARVNPSYGDEAQKAALFDPGDHRANFVNMGSQQQRWAALAAPPFFKRQEITEPVPLHPVGIPAQETGSRGSSLVFKPGHSGHPAQFTQNPLQLSLLHNLCNSLSGATHSPSAGKQPYSNGHDAPCPWLFYPCAGAAGYTVLSSAVRR